MSSRGSIHDTGCSGLVHWDDQRDGMEREVGGVTGWGTRVYPWQIHLDVWQNQYNKVISLQLKLINLKFKKSLNEFPTCFLHLY